MSFNFDAIETSGSFTEIVNPSSIFDALPEKSNGYEYLRAVQKEVLDSWFERRTDRDIVIKTNTGSGKTIIGLMVLQSCLNENMGPALYLCPTTHLASQVSAEAAKLGMATISDPTHSSFIRGEAICVASFQRLYNGRSIFGILPDYFGTAITVGSIVIDDAHSAIDIIDNSSTVKIPNSHQIFTELLNLFEDDIKSQSLTEYLNIAQGSDSSIIRIPFWSWQDKIPEVIKILAKHRDDDFMRWNWPLISDHLTICQAVIAVDGIEISLPCPPIEKFPSFTDANRRVYLTATLADDSVLVSHFAADPDSITKTIVPSSASDIGDRLILYPEDMFPSLRKDDMMQILQSLSTNHNCVVIVPSHYRARKWHSFAARIASTNEEITSLVSALSAGHVGIAVIVNRYDGTDLPDDACRILVIDGLPRAQSSIGRREWTILRDSRSLLVRQLQKLEQGMGRAVRSPNDSCVVLLLEQSTTSVMVRGEMNGELSAATQAQLKLSQKVARSIIAQGIASLEPAIDGVARGDSTFRRLSREALVGARYTPATLSSFAISIRAAYESAITGDFGTSVRLIADAMEAAAALGDNRLVGLLGESQAAYLNFLDPVAAQQALMDARNANAFILRPIQGVSYQKVNGISAQSSNCLTFLNQYSNAAEFMVSVREILSDVGWNVDRTDEAEESFRQLGKLLGFGSQRPEKEFGVGPDVLWSIGPHHYLVIEAKTGAEAPLIWKHHIDQLGGSTRWCERVYTNVSTITPVMVHPSSIVEATGTPPPGTRVITAPKIRYLRSQVMQFAAAISLDMNSASVNSIDERLQHFHLDGISFLDSFTVSASIQTPREVPA